MLIPVILVAMLAATDVIAAPAGPDHPPAEGGSPVMMVLMLALAPVALAIVIRLGWPRLASAPARPRGLAPELMLGLAVLMLVLAAVGVQLARSLLGVAPTPDDAAASVRVHEQAMLAAGAYALQATVLMAVIVLWRRASPPRPDERLTPARSSLVGALAILLWWPVVQAVGWSAAAVVTALGGEASPIAHETLVMLVEAPVDASYVMLVALVVLAAPVLEELLYRGLVQDALRSLGLGPWVAISLTSGMFAAMHWQNSEPHAVVALFVLSLGFGWALERTGRLTAPIVMHVLFNLGNLLVAVRP